MKSIFAVIIAGLLAVPSAAFADEEKAQTTIKNQLEAFLARDDNKAYSYAAPNVQQIFPNVNAFMSMVRNGYPQVYSPKFYSFGRTRDLENGQIAQEVELTGPKNREWAALYTLEVQADGEMRITGVQVVPSSSTAL